MRIASPGTRLSRMFMDNISLGVKFSRTLRNGNALLVIAKRRGSWRQGKEKKGWYEVL